MGLFEWFTGRPDPKISELETALRKAQKDGAAATKDRRWGRWIAAGTLLLSPIVAGAPQIVDALDEAEPAFVVQINEVDDLPASVPLELRQKLIDDAIEDATEDDLASEYGQRIADTQELHERGAISDRQMKSLIDDAVEDWLKHSPNPTAGEPAGVEASSELGEG